MKATRSILALLLGVAILAVAAAAADEKTLVNVDESGVFNRGHDPVAYFTEGKAVKGKPALSARHGRATYHFASDENRRAFFADPGKYLPMFGGFCGYGLSRGYLAPTSPDAFQIVGGRLILQYNRDAVALFAKDLEENLAKAEAHWPALVEKHGK